MSSPLPGSQLDINTIQYTPHLTCRDTSHDREQKIETTRRFSSLVIRNYGLVPETTFPESLGQRPTSTFDWPSVSVCRPFALPRAAPGPTLRGPLSLVSAESAPGQRARSATKTAAARACGRLCVLPVCVCVSVRPYVLAWVHSCLCLRQQCSRAPAVPVAPAVLQCSSSAPAVLQQCSSAPVVPTVLQ